MSVICLIYTTDRTPSSVVEREIPAESAVNPQMYIGDLCRIRSFLKVIRSIRVGFTFLTSPSFQNLFMIPCRRSAISSHWKQLGRVCALNRFTLTSLSTRIPSSHIICENNHSLINKGELGRRGYATETQGNLSSFLLFDLTRAPLCNVKGRAHKPGILTSTRSWSPTGDSLARLIEDG